MFLHPPAELTVSSLGEAPWTQIVQDHVGELLDGKIPEDIPKGEVNKIGWKDIWLKVSFCGISHLIEGTG